ncbi:MAG: peptidyl-tRNA hydrolase Pth2 [Candidatus Bathyarchaeota archaeon]
MNTESFEYTQNIVVRTDIKMSRGKLCGQVAHAAVSASEVVKKSQRNWWKRWMDEGQRKIVLKVGSYEELLILKKQAEKIDIPVALIEDRGLTELPPGTATSLGIGPAPSYLVNKVTEKLLLL